MRALLVVNPVATTTSARSREVLASALDGDLKVEVAHTGRRGHAAELARQAHVDGVDLVVTLGGDGTVNEVVNGLLAQGPHPSVPALAVVPGGGTNVFARALGVPRDPVEATGALLAAVRAGRSRAVSLGRADDRWFTVNAGMGWDAEVVARVDRKRLERGTERDTTAGDYVRAGLAQFFTGTDRRHPALTLRRPGVEDRPGLHVAVVANTAPWTYLGDRPLLTSPDAGFDTGLDLYALTRLSTVGTLVEVQRLVGGRAGGSRTSGRSRRSAGAGRRGQRVHREHDLAELTLLASRPTAAQVDGEPIGERTRLTLTSVPSALRVLF